MSYYIQFDIWLFYKNLKSPAISYLLWPDLQRFKLWCLPCYYFLSALGWFTKILLLLSVHLLSGQGVSWFFEILNNAVCSAIDIVWLWSDLQFQKLSLSFSQPFKKKFLWWQKFGFKLICTFWMSYKESLWINLNT